MADVGQEPSPSNLFWHRRHSLTCHRGHSLTRGPTSSVRGKGKCDQCGEFVEPNEIVDFCIIKGDEERDDCNYYACLSCTLQLNAVLDDSHYINSDDEEEGVEEGKEVEQILEQRRSATNGANCEFQIRWKGHGPEGDTWEPEDSLDCPELMQAFWDSRRKSINGRLKTSGRLAAATAAAAKAMSR